MKKILKYFPTLLIVIIMLFMDIKVFPINKYLFYIIMFVSFLLNNIAFPKLSFDNKILYKLIYVLFIMWLFTFYYYGSIRISLLLIFFITSLFIRFLFAVNKKDIYFYIPFAYFLLNLILINIK